MAANYFEDSILYIDKDILEIEEGVIAHGCNCMGVMGAGVAKGIAQRYPNVFREYRSLCNTYQDERSFLLGKVLTCQATPKLTIANCFTQLDYGRGGRFAQVEHIESSLTGLFNQIKQGDRRIKPRVYMPKIGCGLGGLNWIRDVSQVVRQLSERACVEVIVCSL